MMPVKKIEIRVRTTQEIIDRWAALADRRYGTVTQETLDKVAQDGCNWLMKRWEDGQYGIYDWFWCFLAYHCPFKRVQGIAWAKLVFERYLDW